MQPGARHSGSHEASGESTALPAPAVGLLPLERREQMSAGLGGQPRGWLLAAGNRSAPLATRVPHGGALASRTNQQGPSAGGLRTWAPRVVVCARSTHPCTHCTLVTALVRNQKEGASSLYHVAGTGLCDRPQIQRQQWGEALGLGVGVGEAWQAQAQKGLHGILEVGLRLVCVHEGRPLRGWARSLGMV